MRECVAGASRPTGVQPGAQREVDRPAGLADEKRTNPGGDADTIRHDTLHRVWLEGVRRQNPAVPSAAIRRWPRHHAAVPILPSLAMAGPMDLRDRGVTRAARI